MSIMENILRSPCPKLKTKNIKAPTNLNKNEKHWLEKKYFIPIMAYSKSSIKHLLLWTVDNMKNPNL